MFELLAKGQWIDAPLAQALKHMVAFRNMAVTNGPSESRSTGVFGCPEYLLSKRLVKIQSAPTVVTSRIWGLLLIASIANLLRFLLMELPLAEEVWVDAFLSIFALVISWVMWLDEA